VGSMLNAGVAEGFGVSRGGTTIWFPGAAGDTLAMAVCKAARRASVQPETPVTATRIRKLSRKVVIFTGDPFDLAMVLF